MKLSDLEEFADALRAKFQLPNNASAEDQLKEPVADLLKAAGVDYGLTIETLNEEHLSEHKVRPDMGVYVGGLICGYIELKAPGKGADALRLRGKHDKEQWQKLKSLPNLIYTDGREWALYRSGERPEDQPLIKLAGDPTHDGKAAVNADNAASLERLFRDFLTWQPIIPHRPTPLAKYIAPLTRFLRSEIEVALQKSDSAVSLLASEWRQFFFPEADDAQFADAYAQTVTYAMLLARLSGATDLSPDEAASTLDQNNGLLARALELLGQDGARSELNVGFEQLQRSFEALDPHEFLKSEPDLWLYFYEDFLAAYDEELRRKFGVYYTPREVVELQVRLASALLETRFGKHLGFADDGVVFLDPAVGTGTYPVAAIKDGLERVRARYGEGAVAAHARQMARNMHGFEILVGPYAVAHLRLTQTLEASINHSKAPATPHEGLGNRLNIYLADTLASPYVTPPGGLTLTHKKLTEEYEAARLVKNTGEVLVCLGNPPYERAMNKGGWVKYGDKIEGGADQALQAERPIFADFSDPVSVAGEGLHLKNLHNDYVYFWRWALWRLFEKQTCGGVVTFITASSYLAGPGFLGMREVMRRTFDELWILDLGGDNHGARKSPNVFNIQTPVAVAVGFCKGSAQRERPAKVRYARLGGESTEAKLNTIDTIEGFSDVKWSLCPESWQTAFLPLGSGDYFNWPWLNELFPWLHSGALLKRTWPIGENKSVLANRLKVLIRSDDEDRKLLFKESRDRKVTWRPLDGALTPVNELKGENAEVSFARYAYRSFDRMFVILDARFGDYFRPELASTLSDHQCFFSVLMTEPLGVGPAITVASDLPDLNYFCGRGGKIIPLYTDASGKKSNITEGLLDALSIRLAIQIDKDDFAGYVFALLGSHSYARRFWVELGTPGPRVPITKDCDLFVRVAALGKKLIWLHTYAKRFGGDGRGNQVPKGAATTVKGVPTDQAGYPNEYSYDEATKLISVGAGRFGPVAPEVWEFEVSGLKVVQSWLGYRMKDRKGRKSSPLDDIRPESWTAAMSDEFLELLWVLEATLDMEPELEKLLDQVVAGPCFTADELPTPTEAERKPPRPDAGPGSLI